MVTCGLQPRLRHRKLWSAAQSVRAILIEGCGGAPIVRSFGAVGGKDEPPAAQAFKLTHLSRRGRPGDRTTPRHAARVPVRRGGRPDPRTRGPETSAARETRRDRRYGLLYAYLVLYGV